MIRILLIKLLDEKSFQEKRRITLSEVSEKTGISRATLTRIARDLLLAPETEKALEIMVNAYDTLKMPTLAQHAREVLAKNYPDNRLGRG